MIAGLELPRSKEELKRTGILNPWKFDLTSSVVATAPMAAVLGILSWIWPVPAGAPDSPRAPMEDEALKLFESVLPYTLPFILMVTAPVLAWGSLKRKDMTRDSLRRAEWDYLWLDGSLGFLPQSLIAVSGLAQLPAPTGSSGRGDYLSLGSVTHRSGLAIPGTYRHHPKASFPPQRLFRQSSEILGLLKRQVGFGAVG